MEHDPNEADARDSGAGGAAVEQFQRAALDAVRSARALLDAAESVIQEPAAIEAMVNTVSSMARSATEAVAGFAAAGGAGGSTGADSDEDEPSGGFEHISVD
ncbi:MAG: hypothetical protein OSA99_20730 [Acidimicrobiales bacterium]|nr:hypothetical protein [Acidimicrobiales bacterium]